MQTNPVTATVVADLLTKGVNQSSLKFMVLGFESDKWITIKDGGKEGQLTIFDVQDNFSIFQKKNPAESAIMNPDDKILALQAKHPKNPSQTIVQVYKMDTKEKLANVQFDEKIVYWTWATAAILAIVTKEKVYHIDITSGGAKQEYFIRKGPLSKTNCQIIGYELEESGTWASLVGISTQDKGQTIDGDIQLFNSKMNRHQPLQGHSACFGMNRIHSSSFDSTIFSFVEKKRGEQSSKVHFSEVQNPPSGAKKFKKQTSIQYSMDTKNDFPIIMHISHKHGIIYIVTKSGYLFIYEISGGNQIQKSRISQSNIFIGTVNRKTDGIYVINKKGQVIDISCDPNQLIPYIINSCGYIQGNEQIAFNLAKLNGLQGAEGAFLEMFQSALQRGDIMAAATIVADSPGDQLRNQETLKRFKSLPLMQGQPQPILMYFQTLLKKSKLHDYESIELCKLVLAQGKIQYIEKWIKEDKLTWTEPLGDLLKNYNIQLAARVYKKAGCHGKVVQALIDMGQNEKATMYMSQHNMNSNYIQLITNTLNSPNPNASQSAYKLAKDLLTNNPQNVDVHKIAEVFFQHQKLQQMTSICFEFMKENKPEDGAWQTKVLELNLVNNHIQVVEAIFQQKLWSQYDRQQIAKLCQQKGRFRRALENYRDINDIRTCILNTNSMEQNWLISYLGSLQNPQWILQCLQDLMQHNRRANVSIVVSVAVQNYEKLEIPNIIKIFEGVSDFQAIFLFLHQIIQYTEDKDIYFTYIQAAAKCGRYQEIEDVIKGSEFYDPVRVKDFFIKEIQLADLKPLIILCDMHDFVEELIQYLHNNNKTELINLYIFKVSPKFSPKVLGTLIDLEADEKYLKQLLFNMGGNCPIAEIVQEFENRNKLRTLESWLELRRQEGNQTPAIHNALAKIYIDTHKSPQEFLIENQYYDSKVIGKYCEEKDPHLAYTAYKRDWGSCDAELIDLTNREGLFKKQAIYLVERQDLELWGTVLNEENPYREKMIEKVISHALPDSKRVEEVSTTVKAFHAAHLYSQLIGLLENIVLHNSEFSSYEKLQNLLIHTAMKADKSKVLEYVRRLENYDAVLIAEMCSQEKFKLYEESFFIYHKIQQYSQAMNILVSFIKDTERSAEYAAKVNVPEVWSKLGWAYLGDKNVVQAITCYIKAEDSDNYHQVINEAILSDKIEDVIPYMLMVKKTNKDSFLDSELAFAYAKTNKLNDLEFFLSQGQNVDIKKIGDRCFDKGLYEAGRILFTALKNNSKIASCLIKLGRFNEALESATIADTPKTWKELCIACMAVGEFKLAAIAGQKVIIHHDHLDELITTYEKYGQPKEMAQLLEDGIAQGNAHVGIYTELGILYAKYFPSKLMNHLHQYFSNLNKSKLMRVCERYHLWAESRYLYIHYDEYDTAMSTMIEHSPTAWKDDIFNQAILKVANHDMYYKSIDFYLKEHPQQLNDLLKNIASKVDLTKCVTVLRNAGYIWFVKPFLQSVQSHNNLAVNESLNKLYLFEEDYENLSHSVIHNDNFDQLALAKECEMHELIEFRRIAAFLYRRNKKYQAALNLSMTDKMYRDCIDTALDGKDAKLVGELLRFFVKHNEKEYFTACLYTCYEFIPPDVVLELSWRFGLMDFAMPFFVQQFCHLSERIVDLEKKTSPREEKEAEQEEKEASKPLGFSQFGMGMNNMLPPSTSFNTMGNLGMGPPKPMNIGGGFNLGMQQQQQPGGIGGMPFQTHQ